MPSTIILSNGDSITYEDAVERDDNILLRAGFSVALQKFYRELSGRRDAIEALVRHHLKLSDQDCCIVATESQWIRGAFNVCIPIEIKSADHAKLFIFRCPLPHKLAEVRYPGTVDEKMGCEVGAYVWIQEQCPDIRIPHLYGFGFSDGRCVCLLPLILCRHLSHTKFDFPALSSHTKNNCPSTFGSPGFSNEPFVDVWDILPSCRATYRTHRATGFPKLICCSNILVRRSGRCSLIHGIKNKIILSSGTRFFGD